jgi:hypothetical protein
MYLELRKRELPEIAAKIREIMDNVSMDKCYNR